MVDAACGCEGVKFSIDEFTTTLEDSHRNSPHWYVHNVIDYNTQYDAVWKSSKDCCEFLQRVIGLIVSTWVRLETANSAGVLNPALGEFQLHPWGNPNVDTRPRLMDLLYQACKGKSNRGLLVAVYKKELQRLGFLQVDQVETAQLTRGPKHFTPLPMGRLIEPNWGSGEEVWQQPGMLPERVPVPQGPPIGIPGPSPDGVPPGVTPGRRVPARGK
jgi:hypothetical protein